MKTAVRLLLAASACLALGAAAQVKYDVPNRVEQKRTDLSGAPGMEVINSIVTFEPGEFVEPHLHHGVESFYVIQGATIQPSGKDPVTLATGSSTFNLRSVMHGGFKVIGPAALKLYTVHIVDKGKPLYDPGK